MTAPMLVCLIVVSLGAGAEEPSLALPPEALEVSPELTGESAHEAPGEADDGGEGTQGLGSGVPLPPEPSVGATAEDVASDDPANMARGGMDRPEEPERARSRGRIREADGDDDDDTEQAESPDWIIRDGRRLARPYPLTLDLGIWPDTFSVGALLATPVLPRGFLAGVNDSFSLEFGLLFAAARSDYYWNDGETAWLLWPAFGARWDFYLTRSWSTFITLKLLGQIAVSGGEPAWFNVLTGAGADFRINERLGMRMELNYPQGLAFGLVLPLGYTRAPVREHSVAAWRPGGYNRRP